MLSLFGSSTTSALSSEFIALVFLTRAPLPLAQLCDSLSKPRLQGIDALRTRNDDYFEESFFSRQSTHSHKLMASVSVRAEEETEAASLEIVILTISTRSLTVPSLRVADQITGFRCSQESHSFWYRNPTG